MIVTKAEKPKITEIIAIQSLAPSLLELIIFYPAKEQDHIATYAQGLIQKEV